MNARSVRFKQVRFKQGRLLALSALCVLLGCDADVSSTPGEGQVEQVSDPEPSAVTLITLEGRVSLLISPLDKRLSPVALTGLSALPSELMIELRRALKVSGTVNLASDPGAESLPIEAKVWAVDEVSGALSPVVVDEDPFSEELFLFSLSARSATLSTEVLGDLTWGRSAYRFELRPASHPPFTVTAPPRERLTLNLPPLSELHLHSGRLLIDPYSLHPLSGATVVVTQGGRRVSQVVKSESDGRYELAWWSDRLDDTPLTVTVSPSAESGLPVARFRLDPERDPSLLSPGETEALSPVALPRLNPLTHSLVGVEGDDQSVWHGHLTQLWAEEPLSGDPVDPAEVSRVAPGEPQLRAMGLWESQTTLSPEEVGELWVYPREGVLTLRPPIDHPARTTRIELTEIGGDLSSAPLLKQRVLGQVTSEAGAPLEGVELYALQRAWPWVDTPHLPLGERWSFTSVEGGVDLALDPGQYALRLRASTDRGLAPRVVLTEALELGDVTLDPSLMRMSEGSPILIRVLTPEGTPAEAKVELFCELDPPLEPPQPTSTLSEAFWGALRALKRQAPVPPRRVSLTSGLLDQDGAWLTRLSARSCPSVASPEGASDPLDDVAP